MKNKAILVSFIALFVIVFALNTVIATSDSVDYVEITGVKVNDIWFDSNTIAGEVSDTVPVEVYFEALRDVSDVRVKVYIEGYKSEISETTSRFHIVDGSTYVKRFSLKLPSSMDLDDLTEELSLVVRISAKGEESLEDTYDINMQKEQDSLNILSIETPERTVAGSTIALDVVLENNGNERLENIYVKASIPDLGVSRKVYVGDLEPQDEFETDNGKDFDESDTSSKRIYLTLPRNAPAGIYNIEVEAYNYDTSTLEKEQIVVESVATGVLSATTTETLAPGEEATFSVVLINPSDKMAVYTITPEESKGLIVEITEPIVTVSADSSRTVKVNVKATNSVEEGTHLVTVNVINSETSELVSQKVFTINVEKSRITTGNTAVVLTVVLVIIFVVLLIILIVLLSKRPTEPEEFGETSYY